MIKVYATLISILTLGSLFLLYIMLQYGKNSSTQDLITKQEREQHVLERIKFSLVDPNQASKSLKETVEKGYWILIDTKKYAKEYVGNKLNCTNCHFAGGDTLGSLGGGISLAGVAAEYPQYNDRFKRVIDLTDRINSCFERSMNGKPIPLDNDIMLSIVTYLHWISNRTPIYSKVPWLGLPKLKTEAPPNTANGSAVYTKYCAICHQADGQGTKDHPPVWGKDSFNLSAGFGDVGILASFIYKNMPYLDNLPVLTEQEALDVAGFILEKSKEKYP